MQLALAIIKPITIRSIFILAMTILANECKKQFRAL